MSGQTRSFYHTLWLALNPYNTVSGIYLFIQWKPRLIRPYNFLKSISNTTNPFGEFYCGSIISFKQWLDSLHVIMEQIQFQFHYCVNYRLWHTGFCWNSLCRSVTITIRILLVLKRSIHQIDCCIRHTLSASPGFSSTEPVSSKLFTTLLIE